MATMKLSDGSKRTRLLTAAAVVGAAAGVVLYFVFSKADISGADPADRIATIHEITVKRPRGAAETLARAAVEDTSPLVRAEAVAALGHFLDDEYRGAVETATADDDGRVRANAAETLARFADAPAAAVLVKLVGTDKDEQVVRAALRGLAGCDDPSATVMLLETAGWGKSEAVQMQAMKGLLAKFKGKPPRGLNPRDKVGWRDLVQRWKLDGRIRDAYAAAGVKLIDRPGDLAGRDFHPERRQRPGHKD